MGSLGVGVICSGANLDDLGDYRPGLTAAAERHVRHPLQEAGFTKADVRAVAKAWGLPTWDKPAAPCLSSRLAPGLAVTPERTARIEAAEAHLKELGLRDCRVRLHEGELARLEVPLADLPRLAAPDVRNELTARLKGLGFKFVTLDLEGFRSGSLNELVDLTVRARYRTARGTETQEATRGRAGDAPPPPPPHSYTPPPGSGPMTPLPARPRPRPVLPRHLGAASWTWPPPSTGWTAVGRPPTRGSNNSARPSGRSSNRGRGGPSGYNRSSPCPTTRTGSGPSRATDPQPPSPNCSMPIAVHCPECQALFHVGDEFAGRPGRCPECGNVLRVRARPGAAAHPAHADPDPYHTPRPVEAYEDPPLSSRRRRDYTSDEDDRRDDFDDRHRPRRPGQGFDPHARSAAWERVSRGLWYVQVAVLLYAFSQVFYLRFLMTRGMKEPDAANVDTGFVAVVCGNLVIMLTAAVFWLLGRFGGIRVPYVPARGWAKASFGLGLGFVFLFCTFFCLFVMALGAAQGGGNAGAAGLILISFLALFAAALAVVAAEASALVSISQIGKGLKDAGASGWAKLCLGLLVFEIAVGTVGLCAVGLYAADKQQKQQAAQEAQIAKNVNPAPPPDGKVKTAPKGKDPGPPQVNPPPANQPPANQPPPPNPFDAEPLDEKTQILVNLVSVGMLFLYLIVFSITLQKARGAIRREIKTLTGEADKDPWEADHRY